MKKLIKSLILITACCLVACNPFKENFGVDKLGPFKPVSKINEIVILGRNGTFLAYNVVTKKVEETYKLPKSYADIVIYKSGHLLITVKGGGNFNIDVATGKVVNHTIPPSRFYLNYEYNDNYIEMIGKNGYETYIYDVLQNKLVTTYKHKIARHDFSFTLKDNGNLYWFPETFRKREHSKFIIDAKGNLMSIGNKEYKERFLYRKNGYVMVIGLDERENKSRIDKLVSINPFKTELFADNIGAASTTTHKDKVILFGVTQTTIFNKSGKLLFKIGDPESKLYKIENHKKINSYVNYKIINDKLYTFGQIINKGKDAINCCVEIDLNTGEDNWIEVW